MRHVNRAVAAVAGGPAQGRQTRLHETCRRAGSGRSAETGPPIASRSWRPLAHHSSGNPAASSIRCGIRFLDKASRTVRCRMSRRRAIRAAVRCGTVAKSCSRDSRPALCQPRMDKALTDSSPMAHPKVRWAVRWVARSGARWVEAAARFSAPRLRRQLAWLVDHYCSTVARDAGVNDIGSKDLAAQDRAQDLAQDRDDDNLAAQDRAQDLAQDRDDDSSRAGLLDSASNDDDHDDMDLDSDDFGGDGDSDFA